MIWAVAVLSALVDNISITIALIPVIQKLAAGGINIIPLWWPWFLGPDLAAMPRLLGLRLISWWYHSQRKHALLLHLPYGTGVVCQ